MKLFRLILLFFLTLLPTVWGAALTWFFYHMGWIVAENGGNNGACVWFICIVVLGFVQILCYEEFSKETR